MASQCPKCAVPLKKTFDLGGSGDLAECRRCGRSVLSRAAECANCGVRHPARSYARGIAVAAISFVALSGWITMALVKERSPERHRSGVSLVTKASATPADSKTAAPAVIQSKSAEMRSPPARLIFVTPADTKRVAKPPESRPAGDTVRREAARLATVSAPAPTDSSSAVQPKVVAGWANVREEPKPDAAVVTVLRPGQQVEVVRRRGGWWAVYAEGRRVGYVSRSLLSEEAPPAGVPVTN
ncbi:MAG: SH3 domain-containing protein [Gemmatimonadetes bacterium]|nr:SH3 domain-containing protein [Gemmatimonadota bacterium]